MFPTLNLIRAPCPDHEQGVCTDKRFRCPFSHDIRAAASSSVSATAPVPVTRPAVKVAAPSSTTASPSDSIQRSEQGSRLAAPIAPSLKGILKKRSMSPPSEPRPAKAVKPSPVPPPSTVTTSTVVKKEEKPARNAYVKRLAEQRVGMGSGTSVPTVSVGESPRKENKAAATLVSKKLAENVIKLENGTVQADLKPKLALIPNSYMPLPQRQRTLDALYAQLAQHYAVLLPRHPRLAAEHALMQEAEVYAANNKHSYKTASISALVAIKKRKPIDRKEAKASLDELTEVGTQKQVEEKRKREEQRRKGRLSASRLERYLLPVSDFDKWGYMASPPPGVGSTKPSLTGQKTACTRCGSTFVVLPPSHPEFSGRHACSYHHGRKHWSKGRGEKKLLWSCCKLPIAEEGPNGQGACSWGPHVFKEEDVEALHEREAFISIGDLANESRKAAKGKGRAKDDDDDGQDDGAQLAIAALDCELSYTTAGMSLTRLTVIDGEGRTVLDELVAPGRLNAQEDDKGRVDVLDLNTRFSGITDLSMAVFDLPSIRKELARFVGPQTVLVGHGLENDLRALRLTHQRIVDTAILFPHPKGPPFRPALRDLTSQHLGKFIQDSDPSIGHSSAEDASMALELVRWRVVRDQEKGL